MISFASWKYFSGGFVRNDLTDIVKFEEDKNKSVVKQKQEQETISKSTIQSIKPANRKENEETNSLGCSEENPPTIFYGKGGNILNLCGEKTSFQAYEFEKENIILFQSVEWNKNELKHYYSLKTISTVYPYEIKILTDNKNLRQLNIDFDNYDLTNDLYFKETIASGPGDLYELFIFSPKTQEFMIVENIYFNNTHSLFLHSSVSKNGFLIDKEKAASEKDISDDCYFLSIGYREKDDLEKVKKMYCNFFPEKVPYFNYGYHREEVKDLVENPVGFFDFKENKFIEL